jgi:hypothetical protein
VPWQMFGVSANLLRGCGRFMWQNGLSFLGTSRVECPQRQDTIAALAADLVSLRLEVMVAWGPGFGLVVKHATRQTPVVFCSMSTDPVDLGLVSNPSLRWLDT